MDEKLEAETKSVTDFLKIVEDGEETNTNSSSKEENPPPPPDFANKNTERHKNVEILNENAGELRIAVHQDIRRSFSVDSPISSNLANNSKLNTSMITISDTSNSLAINNQNQVTVVTTHPPVIIDNSREVVIVSNDTNKTQHVHDDDDYQINRLEDSLENSPKKCLRLDESEVLIVSPFEDENKEEKETNKTQKVLDHLDTSHGWLKF